MVGEVGVRVSPVVEINDAADFGLEQGFGAVEAGAHGGVCGCALDGDSKPCSGDDGILLGMDTDADIVASAAPVMVPFPAADAAAVHAVGDALWGAIVPGGNNPVFFDQNGTDFAAQAVGIFSNRDRDPHVVRVGFGHDGAEGWWAVQKTGIFQYLEQTARVSAGAQ